MSTSRSIAAMACGCAAARAVPASGHPAQSCRGSARGTDRPARCVVDIGLAPRDVLDVPGIGRHQGGILLLKDVLGTQPTVVKPSQRVARMAHAKKNVTNCNKFTLTCLLDSALSSMIQYISLSTNSITVREQIPRHATEKSNVEQKYRLYENPRGLSDHLVSSARHQTR